MLLKDIIKDVVNSMDLTIKVNSFDGNVLQVCKTLHVNYGKIVTDGAGKKFKVTSFTNDQSITVVPFGHVDDWNSSTLIAPKPLFIHGGAYSVNEEYLSISNDTRKKTPFIWLLRGYNEIVYGRMDSKERTADIRLFFMDETNEPEWLNDEHDVNAINPMQNLVNLFIETIEKNPMFLPLINHRVKDRARFGVEIPTKGSDRKIIDDDLSGCELNVSIDLLKGNCKC
jgi:hypothetical protein